MILFHNKIIYIHYIYKKILIQLMMSKHFVLIFVFSYPNSSQKKIDCYN